MAAIQRYAFLGDNSFERLLLYCVSCQTLEWVCHPSENRRESDEITKYDFSQPLCVPFEDELCKLLTLAMVIFVSYK